MRQLQAMVLLQRRSQEDLLAYPIRHVPGMQSSDPLGVVLLSHLQYHVLSDTLPRLSTTVHNANALSLRCRRTHCDESASGWLCGCTVTDCRQ